MEINNLYCHTCTIDFRTTESMEAHTQIYHRLEPVNTSGRSKVEIVKNWEEKNVVYLIEVPKHDRDCRCWDCQKAFLALMGGSNDSQNGFDRGFDRNVLSTRTGTDEAGVQGSVCVYD